jgi:hypothetical protein
MPVTARPSFVSRTVPTNSTAAPLAALSTSRSNPRGSSGRSTIALRISRPRLEE